MDSPLSFVKSLEIVSPDAKLFEPVGAFRSVKGTDKKQANADGGSIVSFVDGVTSMARSDALNSTLLAQLAADKQHDRFDETKEWYKFYVSVLGKVGWVMQDFDFKQYSASGAIVSVSQALIDVIKSIASDSEVGDIQKALDALKSSENTHWYQMFAKKSSGPNKKGTIQILPCSQDSSGQLLMRVGCLTFSGISTDERWLWIDYQSAEVKLFQATQTSTLDNDVYKQVRQAVIDKLGDNAKSYIGDLDI
jgi:hypothetical protein